MAVVAGFHNVSRSSHHIRPRVQVYNYEKVGTPFNHGGWWFFFRNNGLQNQSVSWAARILRGISFVPQ